jgi:hypothetical protein
MAQRNSEYERRPDDDYATPNWVTDALLGREKFPHRIYNAVGATDEDMDPPLRRGGLGRDHLCFAHVASQVGAAAHRPLGD